MRRTSDRAGVRVVDIAGTTQGDARARSLIQKKVPQPASVTTKQGVDLVVPGRRVAAQSSLRINPAGRKGFSRIRNYAATL